MIFKLIWRTVILIFLIGTVAVFIFLSELTEHREPKDPLAVEKARAKLQSDYASKDDDERAGPGESHGLSHTSTDTTIDLGETHSFKVITEVFYEEVNWYIQRKDNTGWVRWLYSNSGGNKANKAEVNIEFSSDNGIEPYTVYVLTARVTRESDNTTYDIIYEISIGP